VKDEYPFVIRRLSEEEGSGYLIEYPDLPGCMSDGQTPEKAIANGRDAVKSYLLSCRKYGDKIPKPGTSASGSGGNACRGRFIRAWWLAPNERE
jgi:antitoxin HicB